MCCCFWIVSACFRKKQERLPDVHVSSPQSEFSVILGERTEYDTVDMQESDEWSSAENLSHDEESECFVPPS